MSCGTVPIVPVRRQTGFSNVVPDTFLIVLGGGGNNELTVMELSEFSGISYLFAVTKSEK